ncbi:MAG: hypothetical protein OZ921_18940 [Sorangiineae bacterium]|nr:hypothetical protein [Polyangiaceae bacterium]MEB2324600.1 hypothetical protein [Sorangiineae bacterium]
MRATVWVLALAVMSATSAPSCKKKQAMCAPGPRLATLTLPAVFHVSKSGKYLGVVTVVASGEPAFAAAGNDPAAERALAAALATATREASVPVSYETYRDGVRAQCSVEVKVGSPEYADAVRQHLSYDLYYEVADRAP